MFVMCSLCCLAYCKGLQYIAVHSIALQCSAVICTSLICSSRIVDMQNVTTVATIGCVKFSNYKVFCGKLYFWSIFCSFLGKSSRKCRGIICLRYFCWNIIIFNRPGVAGAVLQSPPWLNNLVNDWAILQFKYIPNFVNPKPEELGSRPSKCPKLYNNRILGKQNYAKKCVNFVEIQIATKWCI